MPATKSAKKKLRQDKKRQQHNKNIKEDFKIAVKKAKLEKTETAVRQATKAADKAVKNYIIHKNKAARIKSALSKLLKKDEKQPKQEEKKKTPAMKKNNKKKNTSRQTK